MAARRIRGIVWAEPCLRPKSLPDKKPKRGSKAEGLRFETRLARALGPRVVQGQWFRFLDDNGPGHCQPDLLLVGKKRLVVIECKLTYTEEGILQLQDLYFPVLRTHYARHEVMGVLACRNLTPKAPAELTFPSLRDAIVAAQSGQISIFHWFGAAGVDIT